MKRRVSLELDITDIYHCGVLDFMMAKVRQSSTTLFLEKAVLQVIDGQGATTP